MGRCLLVAAGRAHEGGPHGKVGDFSILHRENEDAGLALATLPVNAACPMRARTRAMRRGHRVSVAKGRPDRNAGGEGWLRGRDGGACSECRVNNFHLRGCTRFCGNEGGRWEKEGGWGGREARNNSWSQGGKIEREEKKVRTRGWEERAEMASSYRGAAATSFA